MKKLLILLCVLPLMSFAEEIPQWVTETLMVDWSVNHKIHTTDWNKCVYGNSTKPLWTGNIIALEARAKTWSSVLVWFLFFENGGVTEYNVDLYARYKQCVFETPARIAKEKQEQADKDAQIAKEKAEQAEKIRKEEEEKKWRDDMLKAAQGASCTAVVPVSTTPTVVLSSWEQKQVDKLVKKFKNIKGWKQVLESLVRVLQEVIRQL